VACCVLVSGFVVADDAVIAKSLVVAKGDYEKTSEKARANLVSDLNKKAKAAQKAGDLKTLEMVEAEIDAFEKQAVLPKSIPVKAYEAEVRKAKTKLEDAYTAAVKEFTKNGKRAEAKAVQSELDDFKKGITPTKIARPEPVDIKKGMPPAKVAQSEMELKKGGPPAKTAQEIELKKGTAPRSETRGEPLFNGKDLTGWRLGSNPKIWGVEDGRIVYLGDGRGWILTEKEYSNFEFQCEYRFTIRATDSGITIRSQPNVHSQTMKHHTSGHRYN
jgi:hypothetical protein